MGEIPRQDFMSVPALYAHVERSAIVWDGIPRDRHALFALMAAEIPPDFRTFVGVEHAFMLTKAASERRRVFGRSELEAT